MSITWIECSLGRAICPISATTACKRASNRISSSACLRSVTSSTVPRTSTTWPSTSRSTSPRMVTRPESAVGSNQLQIEVVGRPGIDRSLNGRVEPSGTLRSVETEVLLVCGRGQHRIAPCDMGQSRGPGYAIRCGIPPPTAHPSQPLGFSQLHLSSGSIGSSALHVAAVDNVSVPGCEAGQQGHHHDGHQADHAPVGVEASGKGPPAQHADRDRNEDGGGQ